MATFNKLLRKFIYTEFYFTGNELLKKETLNFLNQVWKSRCYFTGKRIRQRNLNYFYMAIRGFNTCNLIFLI